MAQTLEQEQQQKHQQKHQQLCRFLQVGQGADAQRRQRCRSQGLAAAQALEQEQ